MLSKLRVDGASERALRVAARPRFSGQDTVSNNERPIRMAVDVAARVPGAGWYLTGWLLDPLGLVSAVTLRGQGGQAERLDARWTRIIRQDVSAGFRGDARFEGRIVDDAHGFTVFVPHRADAQRAWLELELAGADCAFMPLSMTTVDGSDGRRSLLQSFDIHKASAVEIVDQHLGPLFHAMGSASPRATAHRVLRTASTVRGTAIVVPLVDAQLRTNIVVAGLARSDASDVGTPVFVCAPSLADKSQQLLAELDFYDLDASVIVAEQAVDFCDALEIGARATNAARLLFLSPRVHGVASDWATRLLAALGDHAEPAVVSPTLLYEDWSIRFAGFDSIRFLEAVPYVDAAATHAGYPRDRARTIAPAPTLAASIDCCAMTRAAFDRVDGFSAGYALAELRGLDLFLRMRAAGVAIQWNPGVELYAIEDAIPADDYASRAGEMIDGWSFRATWKGCLPAAVDPVEAVAVAEEPEASPRLAAATAPPLREVMEERMWRESKVAGS
jgi:hypothetical protein